MTRASNPIPKGHHTVTPGLTIEHCADAIRWYKRALGAVETSRSVGPDGKILHAELRIGNSFIMVKDPVMGMKGPKGLGGSPAAMWLYVEDCDALFDRAIGAGGKVQGTMGEMADQFWGDRCGTFTDPYGYSWSIATHIEDLSPDEMQTRQDVWMRRYFDNKRSSHASR